MNKKNIIFLVVDSVYENNTHATSYRKSPMPFLEELQKKSLTCTNMHSQAPFTESAIMPLLTGNDLLDNGGYLQKFKYRKSLMKELSEQGYQTFVNHTCPLIDPIHVFGGCEGISDNYYIGFVEPMQLWDYRFKYYTPLYLDNALSKHEIDVLVELLESNFIFWIQQLQEIINHDESTQLLYRYSTLENIDEELKMVQKEYNTFNDNRYIYLDNVMKQGLSHSFYHLKPQQINKKVTVENQKIVHEKYYSIFKEIYKLNKQRNLKNNKFPIASIIEAIKQKDLHAVKSYIAMYKAAVIDKDLFERINPHYDVFNAAISMHSYIEHMLSWIDEKKNPDQPYFAYLHVDDCHAPESFFSYDSNDLALLDSEFQAIKEYLSDLPENFYGSLSAQLSYLYCDGCIRFLFEELQKRNLIDDTIICITADHGFSYTYECLRTNYVNNQHKENYHPFFTLYGKNINPQLKTAYFDTKDIFPTLLAAANCDIPHNISGENILTFTGRDYCTVEYMGGGCPDMLRRDMILGVRTDHYSVVVLVNVMQKFDTRRLDQVYDLQSDCNEYHNIAKKISLQDISYELSLIEKRFNEIKEDFMREPNSFR